MDWQKKAVKLTVLMMAALTHARCRDCSVVFLVKISLDNCSSARTVWSCTFNPTNDKNNVLHRRIKCKNTNGTKRHVTKSNVRSCCRNKTVTAMSQAEYSARSLTSTFLTNRLLANSTQRKVRLNVHKLKIPSTTHTVFYTLDSKEHLCY